MADLPFQAEYAKSGRAACKGCREPIPKDSLRIAAMLQSAFFDGKQANWYHHACFFAKQRPKTVADIGNFSALRYEDQEKIKKTLEENKCGVILPDVKKGKGKKRSNGVDSTSLAALKDFTVEYSKSSRATCRSCDIKITKGEVRICKKVYDTEIGQKFGGQPLWHHVKCFAKDRSELMFLACGDVLPGFNSLTKEDKIIVKKELPAVSKEEIPIKKLKEEPVDAKEKKASDDEEKELKNQNKLFYKYRDNLKKHLSKNERKLLLEYNKQNIPVGEDKTLDLLADIMTFGTLSPCEVCKNGQLVLDTNGYVCSGDLTEWTTCKATTQNPHRTPFKIEKSLKDNDAFKKYKFKAQTRKFRNIKPSTSFVKVEKELEKPKSEIPVPPLKNLEFFCIGLRNKDKEEVKIKILKMGGNVVSKFKESLVAVISTPREVELMSEKMTEVENMGIQVIEKSFFDSLKPDTKVSETIDLIVEKNIASWGTNPTSRISQDVIDGKSAAKSTKSIYLKSEKSGITKLKLKGGSAVDPDSELDKIAHVYTEKKGAIYSVVLGLTDIVTQKNSYYKMQILEADNKTKYWLFKSWGRIGTTIGGTSLKECESVYDALDQFEDKYLEKTGYPWFDGKGHLKAPGKMYPIDIDYSSDTVANVNMDDGSSKLPVPVQSLVKMIFDVDIMKKVMYEYELDTEKMPLGKLSRKQLMSGYKVLTELLKFLEEYKKTEKDSLKSKITDATNRFYTLIPHDLGLSAIVTLDNEEVIKTKIAMLDNLLEIEIAYTLLQTNTTETNLSPLDSHYIKLKSEIEPLSHESPEFEILNKYINNTHAETHSSYSLKIVQIFKVVREGEEKRYKPFTKLPNRKLLWHGSRTTNFAGILSQGLRIAPPEAPVMGYMFGKGIYFADMVSKSANYCCTNPVDNVGMLLLCEVALGKMHQLQNAKYISKLPSGYHSVMGMGKTEPDPSQNHELENGTVVPLGLPVKKKVQSSLLYNEYIVYDVAQVNIKYLCQMKFDYNC